MRLTEHLTEMMRTMQSGTETFEDFERARESLFAACKAADEDRAQLIGSEYTLRIAIQAIHALYDCIMARDHILEPDEQEACTQAEAMFEVEKTMNRIEAQK